MANIYYTPSLTRNQVFRLLHLLAISQRTVSSQNRIAANTFWRQEKKKASPILISTATYCAAHTISARAIHLTEGIQLTIDRSA